MSNFTFTPKYQEQLNRLHTTMTSKLDELRFFYSKFEDYLVSTAENQHEIEAYLSSGLEEGDPPDAMEEVEDRRKYYDNQYYLFWLHIEKYKGYAKTLEFYWSKANTLRSELAFIMQNREMLQFDPDGLEWEIQKAIRTIVSEIESVCEEAEDFQPWREFGLGTEIFKQYQQYKQVSEIQKGGVARAC